MGEEFDVFLCHNSQDKPAVIALAEAIKARGLRPWLDIWELPPGISWQEEVEALLETVPAVLVIVGGDGMGPWQGREMRAALEAFVEKRARVVPVLLPGVPKKPSLPLFLRSLTWVDLRSGLTGPDLDRLEWGITGKKPGVGSLSGAPSRKPSRPRSERKQTRPADRGPALPEYSARLVIRREGDLYQARWVESEGQDSESFTLRLPLSSKDAADLRWYLEEYPGFVGAGTRARAAGIEAKLDGWGHALFDAVFDTTEGTHVYRNLREAVDARRRVLLTFGTSEADVLVQPWEMMRDKEGPLAFRGVSIRRQLTGTKRVRPHELRLPLRLLLIVSRPTNTGFLDPRTSVVPLLDGLDHLPAEVDFCEPPTLGELEERISRARQERRPFHIVHFDGHGTYLPETGIGALCFEKDDRKLDLVTGRRLGDLLSRLDIPLVILEACRTSDLSEKPVFGSVAPALLDSGVGSVVAYSHSIHVEASRLLVERFYRELAAGLSVGEALAEARARMRAKPDRWLALGPNPPTIPLQDWFVPQLYQVGSDPALVTDGRIEAGASESLLRSSWEERLHGFPPEPPYRFQGRAWELLELGRAFQRHTALVVSGMGGMGKTALAREAAAWWLRANRFEEAVFCSFEQIRSAERAVQLLGQALEGPDFDQRPAGEQQAAAVALFRQRKVLLVWDNFESTLPQYQQTGGAGALGVDDTVRGRLHALYRELTAGNPDKIAGRLLVTCRPDATGLAGIKEMALGGLARPDSLHLLTAIADVKGIDLERPGFEPAEIEDLLDALQDHPLSISLVTPHLKTLTPEEIRRDFARHLDRFTDDTAEEARNRSLRASLAFSASRLSEPARAVLPWLAWFQGGAFEDDIRVFTGLEAEAWAAVRQELVATALVQVEELERFTNPFLRFHPTLPYAARAEDVPDAEAAEQRFLAVYLAVSREVDGALFGKTAAAGMELMAREEANVRSAIDRAFRRGERQLGWALADTLQEYLRRAARPRERDALATWVREQMPDAAGLDAATCAATQQYAWSLFGQGRAGEAVETLRELLRRLETEGLEDGAEAAFEIGTSYQQMGQILVHARRPDLALEPCRKAIEHLERTPGEAARGNLAAALGDLANALQFLGSLPEALEAAERGLAINLELGRDRNAAVGHGRCAEILSRQGRYGEAEARYQEAQRLAKQVGDLELQGTFLQHRGSLNDDQGRYDQAVELYREAIRLFQQANDQAGEMRTCDLLATAEQQRGELDAAESWYARSRVLAEELGDRFQMAVTAQNLGILFQTRAEQTEDPEAREALLHKAVASVEESLAIKLEREDRVEAASSYSQLGVLHRMLGDLDRAEEHLMKGLEVYESLDLPEVWKVYQELANVAKARGDAEAATAWRAKRDAKQAELERLRGGGGGGKLSEEVAQAILDLARAVYAARTSGAGVGADVAEVLAELAGGPEPWPAVAGFLREVGEGGTPAVPGGLPEPLPEILESLLAALR